MEIKRLLTNICSDDLTASKQFYTSLFSFKLDYDSDWFIHLISEGRELELGIILTDHEIVPAPSKGKVSGAYLTFVVEDVDQFYEKAKDLGYSIYNRPK